MPKDTRNFACKMEASLFERLRDYSYISRLSKTAIVELALQEYLGSRMGQSGSVRLPGDPSQDLEGG